MIWKVTAAVGTEAFPVFRCFGLTVPEELRLASWLEISQFSTLHLELKDLSPFWNLILSPSEWENKNSLHT